MLLKWLSWFGAREKPVFNVSILMKSGERVDVCCHNFIVNKNSDNTISGVEWKLAQPGQILFLKLDEIAMITSVEL